MNDSPPNDPGPGVRARRAAIEALLAIEADGTVSAQAALTDALDGATSGAEPLVGADRGLVTTLVFGVLRRRGALDVWLTSASDRGLRGMDAAVLTSLRVGLYQLAALSRVPAFAAVDATLDAARPLIAKRAVGFVHAVLRRLAREVDAGRALGPEPWPAWLARRLERWTARVRQTPSGTALPADRAVWSEPAPRHAWCLPAQQAEVAARLEREGITWSALGPLAPPGCALLDGGPALLGSAAFGQVPVLRQDAGSAAVVAAVQAQPGLHVLDMAAGRGVKAAALSCLGAAVTACDRAAGKLEDAAQLAADLGAPLAATVVADGTAAAPAPLQALRPHDGAGWDVVLLDAPCTALGTIRRRPDVRHRRRAADIFAMQLVQRAMLRRALELVRPGGRIVYATCSFVEEEGRDVVEHVLANHGELRRAAGAPAWATALADEDGDLRTHPGWHGADAFFIARLERPR